MSLVLFDPPSGKSLARLSFWFAVFLAVIGSAMTMSPGAGVGLAAIVAVFAAPGLVLRRRYRIASIVLLMLLALYAWGEYQRGKAYQQRLRERQRDDQFEQPDVGWAPPTVGS